jgi:hypothetical protein
MLSELFLLSLVATVSYLYDLFIYPYILLYISSSLYHNILINAIIILQIDNFSLLNELNTYIKDHSNKMDERYIRIITSQFAYICKKQKEIDTEKYKNKNIKPIRHDSL